MRRPLAQVVRDVCGALRGALYGGAIAAGTALATLALARIAPIAPTVAWCALLALCASELAVALVHWAATVVVTPKILPRLDFSHGHPGGRTARSSRFRRC